MANRLLADSMSSMMVVATAPLRGRTLIMPLPERDQNLLLDAIVSYSDACTLPGLTPSCPYYEETAHGPRCKEQCRDLIAKFGITDREVRDVELEGGGLIMTGRAVPITAAAGVEIYDARQNYITDRSLPVSGQRTSSLLLGLWGRVGHAPIEVGTDREEKSLELIAELERRGIPTERVIQAAMLTQMAVNVAAFAALPLVRTEMERDTGVSLDSLRPIIDAAEAGWTRVLRSAVEYDGGPEEAVALSRRMKQAPRHLIEESNRSPSDWLVEQFENTPTLQYATSSYFIHRVLDWFAMLLTDNLTGLILWEAPPPSVFTALPVYSAPDDDIGLWIWERFTKTQIDEWTTSSLILEWRSHNETEFSPIPIRTWLERRTDPTLIANLALSKLGRRPIQQRLMTRSLSASGFAEEAARRLRFGEFHQAAEIFAGLVELRPADGTAWNNYGFCTMSTDVEESLEHLQRASLYPSDHPATNIGNRMLALHLLHRDADAEILAREALRKYDPIATIATMWLHDDEHRLELADSVRVGEYIGDLLSHIRQGTCQSRDSG